MNSKSRLRALFDEEDTSTLDAFLRFGPAPAIVRITQPDKWEEAVENYIKKTGVSRVEAVRNMDAYFNDPNGWAVAKMREKKYGEVTEYKKSGIQKRPVFSALWAAWIFYFFFILVPSRIDDVGGVKPSALSGGLCVPDVRTIVDGREQFSCSEPGPIISPLSSAETFGREVKNSSP